MPETSPLVQPYFTQLPSGRAKKASAAAAVAATDAANDVLDQSSRFGSDHRLTLFACSKPDRTPTSTMYRLVVQLVQL